MDIIWLEETNSTNSYLKGLPHAKHGTVVAARRQTAGRGQRGNSWEAEPGMNLTFSIMVCPDNLKADHQFAISRAVSIAIAETLDRWMPEADGVSIKWPNDIYVGDRKICGILIENALEGSRIARSVIGVGINVNQEKFVSDAPNPVSMAQICRRQFDLDVLLEDVASEIIRLVEDENADGGNLTASRYLDRLWRADGVYPYYSGEERFDAAIVDVSPMGMLTLERADGIRSTFAFKEVTPVIGNLKLKN